MINFYHTRDGNDFEIIEQEKRGIFPMLFQRADTGTQDAGRSKFWKCSRNLLTPNSPPSVTRDAGSRWVCEPHTCADGHEACEVGERCVCEPRLLSLLGSWPRCRETRAGEGWGQHGWSPQPASLAAGTFSSPRAEPPASSLTRRPGRNASGSQTPTSPRSLTELPRVLARAAGFSTAGPLSST